MVNSPGRQLLEASSAHAITASACKSSKSTAVFRKFQAYRAQDPCLAKVHTLLCQSLDEVPKWLKKHWDEEVHPFADAFHFWGAHYKRRQQVYDVSRPLLWLHGSKKTQSQWGSTYQNQYKSTNHIPQAWRRKGRNSRTCTETAWATASVLPNLSKWEIQRAGTPADFETLLHALAPTPVKSWRLMLYMGHWYMCSCLSLYEMFHAHLRKLTTTSTGMSSQIDSQLNLLPHP